MEGFAASDKYQHEKCICGGVMHVWNIIAISVIIGTKYDGECLLPASYA